MTRNLHRSLRTLLAPALFAAAQAATAAGIDCDQLGHWSATSPQVNQTHIFCGELAKGRLKGFHSRPNGENPTSVTSVEVTEPPNAQGIYSAKWMHTGYTGRPKFSTMYPDACSQEQVLNSALYAAKHTTDCPDGAPDWATCGLAHPVPATADYCSVDKDHPFTIAFAFLRDGRMNTAFPLR